MAFDIFTGLPNQPAGGGLLPSTAPPQVPQGPGLLPLLAGALGTIAGGNRFGTGFLGGLGMAQNQQQQQFQNRMGQFRLQEQARAAQAQRAQAEAAAAARQAQQQQERQAIFQAAVAQGMPEDQAMAIANSQTLGKAFAAEAFKPEKPVGPAGFQAWLQDNPGGTFEQFMRVQASIDPRGTTIQMTPNAQFLSGPGGSKHLFTPGQGVQEVIAGRPEAPILTEEQKAARVERDARTRAKVASEAKQAEEARIRAKNAAELERLLPQYEALASPIPAGKGKELAREQLRKAIGNKLARIRQPTGILTDKEVEMAAKELPEPTGVLDFPFFAGGMETFRKATGLDAGGQAAPAAPQQQAPAGGGVQEGAVAVNPTTGEQIVFRGGQWQPMQ